jgi:hypothetical protein
LERIDVNEMMEAVRGRFEELAYQQYLARRAEQKVVDDTADVATREGLFWRQPDGSYGVLEWNGAWWGYRMGFTDVSVVEAGRTPASLPDEQLEALIVGLTTIKKQRWFVRAEVVAIVDAALATRQAGTAAGEPVAPQRTHNGPTTDPASGFPNEPTYKRTFPRQEELTQSLKDHRLEHDTPSQLADAFRLGWQAALAPTPVELAVTACYFPFTGDAELSWERVRDGQSFAMTVPVTPEQGRALAKVVWPCINWRADALAKSTGVLTEDQLQAIAKKLGEQCHVWEGIGARDVEEVLKQAAAMRAEP